MELTRELFSHCVPRSGHNHNLFRMVSPSSLGKYKFKFSSTCILMYHLAFSFLVSHSSRSCILPYLHCFQWVGVLLVMPWCINSQAYLFIFFWGGVPNRGCRGHSLVIRPKTMILLWLIKSLIKIMSMNKRPSLQFSSLTWAEVRALLFVVCVSICFRCLCFEMWCKNIHIETEI